MLAHHHGERGGYVREDRKSTRLNSSHVAISYAVFCLKKKNSHRLRERATQVKQTPKRHKRESATASAQPSPASTSATAIRSIWSAFRSLSPSKGHMR